MRSMDLTAFYHLPSRRERKPRLTINWDRAVACIIAFSMWPLIFWLVAFVAERRGF